MSASDSIVQQYEIQKKKGIKAEYDKIARSSTPPLNFQKGCPINVDSPNPTPEEIEKYFHHDFARTGQIAIVGFVYSAPIAHTWYQIMEKIVTFRSRMLAVPCKLVLDAFVFSPIAIGECLNTFPVCCVSCLSVLFTKVGIFRSGPFLKVKDLKEFEVS